MAQVLVGRSLEEGAGVTENKTEAVKWYEKAADQGNAAGLLSLALMHQMGKGGLTQNLTNAAHLYLASAERGDVRAMGILAEFYYYGWGELPEDERLALDWYERATQAGDVLAMRQAANLYLSGAKGVPANKTKAIRLYTQAAEAGDETSRAILATQSLGEAFSTYFETNATPAARANALAMAQSAGKQLEPLAADAILTLFSDDRVRTAIDQLKSSEPTDPMRAVYQTVVDLTIKRYRAADLDSRIRLLRDFSVIAQETVVSWADAGEHQRVVELWKDCLRDQVLAKQTREENNNIVSFATACVVSLLLSKWYKTHSRP